MKNTIISVSEVYLSYDKNIILKDLNFSLNKDEVLGIIGMSGAGKTTLLNLLAGLIYPTHGKIKINTKKSKLGYSFQQPCFFEELTIQENIQYFASLYHLDKEITRQRIEKLLKALELYDFKDQYAKKLSGGMKKRLDLILSLINEPELLLLDEPIGELDPILREKVNHLIKEYNKTGKTIVLTSHYFSDIFDFCTHLLILHKGQKLFFGPVDELKEKNEQTINLSIKFFNKKDLEQTKDFIQKKTKLKINDNNIDLSTNELTIHHKINFSIYALLFNFIHEKSIKTKEVKMSQHLLEDSFTEIISKNEHK